MTDPANRFYRYPVARWVVPLLLPTGITADQVTFAGTVLGIAAAVPVAYGGSTTALVVAAVLWELHLVLDCVDGVLARARGTATALGHTYDMFGDTIAYLALAAAMYVFVRSAHPEAPAGAITLAMIASGALVAWAHDFYIRKLTAALTHGTDVVYEDLLAKRREVTARGGLVPWFGYVFGWLQIVGLQPGSIRDVARRLRADAPPPAPGASAEVQAIVASAGTPSARRAYRAISLMSNDNDVTIVTVGLLLGQILSTQLVVTCYATLTLVAGVAVCRRFLRAARVGSA